MFRITRDPSSGGFIQRLAKITLMVLSCLCRQCSTHTHNESEYAAIEPNTSMPTDTVEPFLYFSQRPHEAT